MKKKIQPTWEFNCPKWDQEYKENGILHTFLNYLTRLYSNENFANFYLNSHSMLRNKHKSSKLINVRLCNGSGLSKTNLSFSLSKCDTCVYIIHMLLICWRIPRVTSRSVWNKEKESRMKYIIWYHWNNDYFYYM